ncbi:hypothetical protein ACFC1T_06355 [Kitasatospora sp. NPDC056076]|uniref:hypothetical protein n=1 Tax=Kitasatospora sp. NPDC056076 TaxID=3345703 RepID=UPI0035DB44B2
MAPVVARAVGRGTGAELATVFEQTPHRIAQLHDTAVEITRSPRTYHSSVPLREEAADTERHADACHVTAYATADTAAGALPGAVA